MSAEELRELFTLDRLTLSNTYDSMCQHQQVPDGLMEALLCAGAGREEGGATAPAAAGLDCAHVSGGADRIQGMSERGKESTDSTSLHMQLQAFTISKKQASVVMKMFKKRQRCSLKAL
jgi:hypothetical protein